MRRVSIILSALAVLAAPVVLAGCTSSSGTAPSSRPAQTVTSTTTQTRSASTGAPEPGTPTPVGTGPTTAATVSACPLISTGSAADKGGMRLGRITVLKASGKTVGCRFYGLQTPNAQCDATCLSAEKLPPGNQAVIEITTVRYSTAVDAHNAIALIARKGTSPQQIDMGGGNIGVCYQTDFYPKDKGTDGACTFSVAKLAVVVKTVVDTHSAGKVSMAVAAKL